MLASDFNQLEKVFRKFNCTGFVDKYENTLLHLACKDDLGVEIVVFLIKNGADIF